MPVSRRVRDLLARRDGSTRIAVVGASNDGAKYGNVITRDLRRKGFAVFPVNPHEAEIAGLPVVRQVREIPGAVHIVDLVVPAPVSLEVLAGLPDDPGQVIWLQPGSYDARVVHLARERFEEVVAGDCIMVET